MALVCILLLSLLFLFFWVVLFALFVMFVCLFINLCLTFRSIAAGQSTYDMDKAPFHIEDYYPGLLTIQMRGERIL